MTPTSFDFSTRPELSSLAQVVRDLQASAAPLGIHFFLMGAMANLNFASEVRMKVAKVAAG